MKDHISFQTTPRTVRDALLTLALCILAAHLPMPVMGQSVYSTPYTFITLAGTAEYGSTDGIGSAAQFNSVDGVAVDSAGNIYVADNGNDTIRKVTPAGVVSTLAGLAGSNGSTDGTGRDARLSGPYGMAVDNAGNIYLADWTTIRKVTPAGVVTTLAGLAGSFGTNDGTGSVAQFGYAYYGRGPNSVALDSAGNLYIADTYNNTIRKMTPAGTNWMVTTLAGLARVPGTNDGIGSAARFNQPYGIAADSTGNVYVADTANKAIRKITPMGVVTTLAGQFASPYGLAVDAANNIYVLDAESIRRITPAGVVTTLAGGYVGGYANGTNRDAQFDSPQAVAVDSSGNLYVADNYNRALRKVAPVGTNWVVTTLAGTSKPLLFDNEGSLDGPKYVAEFNQPESVAVDGAGNVYVAENPNNDIRQITPAGVVTTIAGLARFDASDAPLSGSADGVGTNAWFAFPMGVAVDSATNVYVADTQNNSIRKITPSRTNWIVTTLASGFYNPQGVAVDSAGNVYVADTRNSAIREVTPGGVVTTLAGSVGHAGTNDGIGSAARFIFPQGLAVDSATNIYVADTLNDTIRKITPSGTNWVVTTLAGQTQLTMYSNGVPGSTDGTGSAALFNGPTGVAVDNAGNVYVADKGNNTIRRITSAGVVTTLAGLAGKWGPIDGTGSNALLQADAAVAVDSAGNLYVADAGSCIIRKGFPASSVSAPILQPPGLSHGQLGFGITGMADLSVEIQSSPDFSSWQTLGTYTLGGGTSFCVPATLPQGAQFYRAHVR